jgi:hypothetical protein
METDMKDHRTSCYQMTVRMVNGMVHSEDLPALAEVKKHVKWYNTLVDKEGDLRYGRITQRDKIRVKLQGRLGKDNPAAVKYRTGRFNSHQCIRLKDAATADVYIYRQT